MQKPHQGKPSIIAKISGPSKHLAIILHLNSYGRHMGGILSGLGGFTAAPKTINLWITSANRYNSGH
jgi:hypothetical protein